MALSSNEILLEHPSGANVLLVGTQHVSCTHGSRVSTSVERLRPSAVLLELDQVWQRLLWGVWFALVRFWQRHQPSIVNIPHGM